MHPYTLAALAVLTAAVPVNAQATTTSDTTSTLTFGGFVDGYYAFDFNRPRGLDRAFTTQPARHNEFNVNLAFIEAKLDGRGVRGRLALQAGTSVQANYAGEPRIGSVSGPELARHLQEAVVGVKVGSTTWVDGGIFLSHIGMEGFISRDNPMYTRSLVADYSPYYETGVKVTWQATPEMSALVTVVNGWQNLSETNAAKSAGVRLDYTPSSALTLSYYNYIGDEAPDSSTRRRIRFFNGVGLKAGVTPALLVLAELDYGTQEGSGTSARTGWYGAMLTGRYQATPTAALVARIERFDDRDQVIIATGVADGFRANGASIGLDIAPQKRVLWRSELRGIRGSGSIFPDRSGALASGNALVVTSLALTF